MGNFAAIFDFDGTLADTSGDLLQAANQQFLSLGYDAPLSAEDRNTALTGGRAMLRLGAKRLNITDVEAFAQAHYQPFLHYYRAHIYEKTELYPHALEVLQNLKSEGWALGICTNKPIELMLILSEKMRLGEYFSSIIGAGSFDVVKPDPKPLLAVIEELEAKPARAILIGDSLTDFHTAKNAKADVLLVDFDETQIAKTAPNAPIAQDFLAVEKYLKNWREEKNLT